MDIRNVLVGISKNFLSLDNIVESDNFFICLIDGEKKYKININEPDNLIEKDFISETELCIEIKLEDAVDMLEGKLNVNDALFNGGILLKGSIDVLNKISKEIEKTT